MLSNKRNLLFVFATILSVLLVACGTTADESSESVELSQVFTYVDELGATVSIDYPDGWSAEDANGSAGFASTEELLVQAQSSDLPNVGSGEVVAISLALPSEMVSFMIEDGEEVSATGLANSFVTNLVDTEGTVGDVEEITLGEQSAAVVQATQGVVDIVLVTIDLGEGNYALVFGATAQGEGDSIRATIEAMAGSIDYTVAEAE